MEKILFISKRFNNYCKTNFANKAYIVDYYDIEAQKALNYIGYCVKSNPQVNGKKDIYSEKQRYDYVYDLDNHTFISDNKYAKSFGVIFSCR